MIEAVGTDVVDIARIEEIRRTWNMKFLKRVYSDGEIAYCEKKYAPAQHYAARFAVKEAFLKCLGVGIFNGIALRDIEVVNDAHGKPAVKVSVAMQACIGPGGIKTIHVSISHTDTTAAAIVILERNNADQADFDK